MLEKPDIPFKAWKLDSSEESRERISRAVGVEDRTHMLLMCSTGTLSVQLDGQNITMEKNSILVFPTLAPCRLTAISDDMEGVMWKVIGNDGLPFASRILDTSTQLSIVAHPLLKLDHFVYERLYEKMGELGKLVDVFCEPGIVKHSIDILFRLLLTMAATITYAICYLYATRLEKPNENIDRRDMVVTKFMASLSKNYMKERSVKFYASEQKFQSSYFSSIIKSKTGQPANKWIDDIVIKGSKEMLLWSDMTIKEVAYKLNFPSQSFFGKYFRKHVGMSPKEFRKTKRVSEHEGQE